MQFGSPSSGSDGPISLLSGAGWSWWSWSGERAQWEPGVREIMWAGIILKNQPFHDNYLLRVEAEGAKDHPLQQIHLSDVMIRSNSTLSPSILELQKESNELVMQLLRLC